MEEVVIDWKDSRFEEDQIYEDINAPQWIDFSANDLPLDDDEAWFCRSDCNHPKKVSDFFSGTIPNSSKLKRSANASKTHPSGDRNSNTPLKKRGTPMNKDSKSTKHVVKDSENQNTNFLTPPSRHAKPIKMSTEKKKADHGSLQKEKTPRRLKNTFSARNLFTGRDMLNQITEFCNELKRLATITKKNDELENSPIAENITSTKRKNDKRVLQKATPPKAFQPRPLA